MVEGMGSSSRLVSWGRDVPYHHIYSLLARTYSQGVYNTWFRLNSWKGLSWRLQHLSWLTAFMQMTYWCWNPLMSLRQGSSHRICKYLQVYRAKGLVQIKVSSGSVKTQIRWSRIRSCKYYRYREIAPQPHTWVCQSIQARVHMISSQTDSHPNSNPKKYILCHRLGGSC